MDITMTIVDFQRLARMAALGIRFTDEKLERFEHSNDVVERAVANEYHAMQREIAKLKGKD